MRQTIEIIPTVVPESHDDLVRRLHTIGAFTRHVHVDVDDGVFTQRVSWPYTQPGMFFDIQDPTLDGAMKPDVHLMVQDPFEIGQSFIRAGVGGVIAHIEAFRDVETARHVLEAWRAAGAQEVGLALLIDTPLDTLTPLATRCDVVQVMSVAQIGAQGASFDARAIDRVRVLHGSFPELPIIVDGGVSEENAADLVKAGATRLSIGAAIMQNSDPKAAYEHLQEVIHEAVR